MCMLHVHVYMCMHMHMHMHMHMCMYACTCTCMMLLFCLFVVRSSIMSLDDFLSTFPICSSHTPTNGVPHSHTVAGPFFTVFKRAGAISAPFSCLNFSASKVPHTRWRSKPPWRQNSESGVRSPDI